MSLYARSPPILIADAAGICRSTSPRSAAMRSWSSSSDGGSCVLDDLALRIAGGRRRREVHVRRVLLRQPDESLRQLGECAEQDEQQARREGVERAGVPGPRAGSVAQVADDRERRGAGRLVDEHQAARSQASLRRHSSRWRTPRRIVSVISSIEASLEKPAAWRWPPPSPERRAISETSSSSVEARRLTRRGHVPAWWLADQAAMSAPSTARR